MVRIQHQWMMRRFIPTIILTAGALAAGGCSRASNSGADETPEIRTINTPGPARLASTQPKPIVLDAVLEGVRLRVSVQNNTDKQFMIGPKNFGLIQPGSNEVIKFDDIEPGFPPAILAPGDQQVGLLSLSGVQNPGSARLVFNHPDCEPVMAQIRPAER